MKLESIEQLNQIKKAALERNDIKTVERVNYVLYEEGHIPEILNYTKWAIKKEERKNGIP